MRTKSNIPLPSDIIVYENFQGLDTSASIYAQENPKAQPLHILRDASCDWRGQIVHDFGYSHRLSQKPISHLRYYSPTQIVAVERLPHGQSFVSESGARLENVHPYGAIISSAVFNRKLILVSRARPAYKFDGTSFQVSESPAMDFLRPSFCTAIQRRFIVSGIPGRETEVHLSRVDAEDVMPDDEAPDDESVLRAGKIDIQNLTPTADQVTGLGSFEQNRLVIFTSGAALIYRIDPDLDKWQLDSNSNVNVGCISHNSIANAGRDLIFCSRAGIHSVRRSEDNGILVYSYSMSDRIDQLYQSLVASVESLEQITSVWDQDMAQYHVFFPHRNGTQSTRLTLSLNPDGGEPAPKFSVAVFLNQTCGDFMSGRLVVGSLAGAHDVMRPGEVLETTIYPSMFVETPELFHGSMLNQKKTRKLILQATGQGTLIVDAIAPDGHVFDSFRVQIDENLTEGNSIEVPLSTQYERPFNHVYDRVRLRLRTEDIVGLVRIVSIGVVIAKER